jgi:hypothetical protein
MAHWTDSRFDDPASWDQASCTDDPVDSIEPIDTGTSEYREAAIRMLALLHVIDSFLCSSREGPPREWCPISLALGLMSTRGKTETAIAEEMGVSRQCISKNVTRFLRMRGLGEQPAFGLKSAAVRRKLQDCH